MIANRQNQRVPVSKKVDEDWYVPNLHYFLALAISNNDKTKTRDDINAANGVIDQSIYDYVMKPIDMSTFKGETPSAKLPGSIRDIDFITPIREKNIGEYIELPNEFTVKVDDPDTSLLRNKQVLTEITPVIEQAIINLVNSNNNNPSALNNQLQNQPQQQPQQGQVQQQAQSQTQQQQQSNGYTGNASENSGVPSSPSPIDIHKVIEDKITSWFDERAKKASNLIRWILDNNDFENKRLTLFNYWWSTENCYIYPYVQNNDVFIDVINPLEGYPITNGNEFVDDQEAFVIIRKLTIDRIEEYYGDDLKDNDRKYLDYLLNSTNGVYEIPTSVYEGIYGRKVFGETVDNNNISFSSGDSVREVVLFFKTQSPRKVLYAYNQLGEVTTEVIQDEDFQFNPQLGHIEVKTEWITETWKQVLLGQDYVGIYLEPKPVSIQVYDAKGHNKLPVVGKKGLLNGIYINPIPSRIVPSLALYQIITLQIERTVAKYKGAVELIPKSMLKGDTGDVKGTMFYKLADNTIIYDDADVDFNTVAQGYRIVGNDVVSNYIKALFEFRSSIKAEAWDMANMNDSRYGAAPASSTVTNNQQNIFRAKLGSSLMITVFNGILLKLYKHILEYSKIAFVDGVSFSRNEDGKITYYNIDEGELTENEYGIFITNAIADFNKLNDYKSLAFNASQNGEFEIAQAAIKSNNVASIDEAMTEFIKQNKQFKQQIEDNKNAVQMQISNNALQQAREEQQARLAEIKLKGDIDTDRALSLQDMKSNDNNK